MESEATRNVLIVGVGGQGVLLASDILGVVCLGRGYEVKKSEVHGMAKRGGVVYSHVRYGDKILSPTIEPGTGNVVLAFEPAEALRWCPYLKPDGTVIANSRMRVPPASCLDRRPDGPLRYPREIQHALRSRLKDVREFDAEALAVELGDHRMCNTVLLGALSNVCEFTTGEWLGAIEKCVKPKTVEMNRRAFLAGQAVQFPAANGPLASPTHVPSPSSAAAGVPFIEIRQTWCKGCEICVRICPQNCLRMDEQNVAQVATAESCIRCMLCEQLCPDLAVSVH
jgi:indolepyruvate ferredoxin oxidoreductase, beta subunit